MLIKLFYNLYLKYTFFAGKPKGKINEWKDDFDITQCPVCKKTNLKRVLTHIDRNKSCKSRLSKDVLDKLREISSQLTLRNKREIM